MIWLPRVCRRSGVMVNINYNGSGTDVSVEINIIVNQ